MHKTANQRWIDPAFSRRAFLKLMAAGYAGISLLFNPRKHLATKSGQHAGQTLSSLLATTSANLNRIGPHSLIESSLGGDSNNFELVLLEGNNLVHYFHDNSQVTAGWQRAQTISTVATGPASIIQSNIGSPGNFEVVVLEGNNLAHWWRENDDVTKPWQRGQIITTDATGPACIIQSTFGSPGNFELVVLEGSNLVHYFHENDDVTKLWRRGQTITSTASGPGCLIQSSFGTAQHFGNFEVVVLEGTSLVHYFHDNADVTLPWTRGQTITTSATAAGAIIESTFGASDHPGNFEVVVLEGTDLVHYFHENDDVTKPWQRGQIITTAAGGPGCLIQSTLGSGNDKNFEVIGQECTQSVVHYWHPNQNVNFPWQRGQIILGEPRPVAMPGTRKVVQLTGEYDRENWDGNGNPPLAFNRTESRAGIRGLDLGSSFVHDGKIYFLFGDTWRTSHDPASGPNDDLDSIAYTTDSRAYAGINLAFNSGPPLTYEDGDRIPQDAFNVPLDGFSHNGYMYVYFSTDHYQVDNNAMMGRSVLARSADGGYRFDVVYSFSADKFINVSVQIVEDGAALGLPSSGPCLLIWGAGRYRASDLFLAYLPLAQVENHGALLFYAQRSTAPGSLIWSSSETDAVPLFCAGCIGEFSVRWNPFLRRWLLLYNSDNPRGIILRTAEHPGGPWSDGQMIFDPGNGYCHFMHQPGCDHLYDNMFGPSRTDEWGGEYGPYQIAPYASGVTGRYTKIYFCLSTWNPYNVMQMSAVISAAGQTLDPNAYAIDRFAHYTLKFARLSVLMATLAAQYNFAWDDPVRDSQSSADQIEWAQLHTVEELRSELQAKYAPLNGSLPTTDDQAEVYATLAVDMITLGADGSNDMPDHTAQKQWALNAIQSGQGEQLVAETNQRIAQAHFLDPNATKMYELFLPVITNGS